MKRKSRILDVKDTDGKVVVSIQLLGGEDLFIHEETASKSAQKPDSKGKQPKGKGCPNDGSLMTDAQKRLLFRLLADRGLEGDKAYDHLKHLFQVDTLNEISVPTFPNTALLILSSSCSIYWCARTRWRPYLRASDRMSVNASVRKLWTSST